MQLLRNAQAVVLLLILGATAEDQPSGSDPSCAPVPVSPKPSMLHCGGKLAPNEPRATKFQSNQNQVLNLQACVNQAFQETAVKAFSGRQTSQGYLCTLYKATGQRMGLSASTDGTRFYNKGCFYQPSDCVPRTGNFRMTVGSGTFADYSLYTLSGGYMPSGLTMMPASDDSDHSIFHLRPDGTLIVNNGLVTGRQDSDGSDYDGPYDRNLYFASNGPVFDSVVIKCSIDADNNDAITCSGLPSGDGVFHACGNAPAGFSDGYGVTIEPSVPDGRTCDGTIIDMQAVYIN